MTRFELGSLLLTWHSGQEDPIYAVGSFYLDDDLYPDASTVRDAIFNLQADLLQQEQMLAGEVVKVWRGSRQVDLREFAGFTPEDLRENVAELRKIIAGLEYFLETDYPLTKAN